MFVDEALRSVQVDGMDVLAVKQACRFAKEHALKNGPIVSKLICYLIFLNFLPIIGYQIDVTSQSFIRIVMK